MVVCAARSGRGLQHLDRLARTRPAETKRSGLTVNRAQELTGSSASAGRPRRALPSRGRTARVLSGIAIGGVALGVCTITSITAFPEQAERVYGTLQRDAGAFRIEMLGELPQVTLGASGGQRELARCDGTFSEMQSYDRAGVPPVWAAHNSCGGDVILPWKLGQEIQLIRDAESTTYVVIAIRDTRKTWATTDDLVGLTGDLALQTCYYGEDRMRFVGLTPAPDMGPEPGR